MYSGSTIHKFSGNLLGAHQKIDRVARRHLERLMPEIDFPGKKAILHFEGNCGPDAIKRKSPARDEPWHFLQPFDETDTRLIELIEHHYQQLVEALKKSDKVRASFEAAWLAHAIVDGLTPAHHFPYEEKLIELQGCGNEGRTSIAKKLIVQASTPSSMVKNNWKMWGPKGLFANHANFETGVAMLMAPLKMTKALPKTMDISEFRSKPLADWFRKQAQDIAKMDLYSEFCKSGWTIPLARKVRTYLAPTIVQAVTLVWLSAAMDAQVVNAI